jgi:hypothetical protein
MQPFAHCFSELKLCFKMRKAGSWKGNTFYEEWSSCPYFELSKKGSQTLSIRQRCAELNSVRWIVQFGGVVPTLELPNLKSVES